MPVQLPLDMHMQIGTQGGVGGGRTASSAPFGHTHAQGCTGLRVGGGG